MTFFRLLSIIFCIFVTIFHISVVELRKINIATELIIQLKMDATKTGLYVPLPAAGDGGEAILRSEARLSIPRFNGKAQLADKEAVVPIDAGWYVAVVRCNCEKRIAADIASVFDEKGVWFESWVPMHKVAYLDKRTNKRKMREKVFLSTFIFCHVSKRHLNDIRFRPDIYKMLTMPGQREIYRISDKEFEDYRRIVENPDLPAVPHSGPLKKGQRVRITEGNMAGLEAYVQRMSGKKVVIGNEIKFICGATIEINRAFLELVK